MTTQNTTAECYRCGNPMEYEPSCIGPALVCPACGNMLMEKKNLAVQHSDELDDCSQRYSRAGIGARYLEAVCDHPEQIQAVVQAVGERRNVFITGSGSGSGKTTLAAKAVMALLDEGVDVVFVNAAVESQRNRNALNAGKGTSWSRMCSAEVLVIDDFGKGNPTNCTDADWYAVLEARNGSGLPTIVTTNYDGGQLIQRLTIGKDDSSARAMVSRLRGGALVIRMDGPDLRLSR